MSAVATTPQFIKTDEIRLRQVLINLISNAVKFTEEGGVSVRIGARSDPAWSSEENSSYLLLHVEVEDTGPGIAEEELKTLFEAFVQTRTGQKAHEGSGLGLVISRKFVQIMGGTLAVTSRVGRGTVMTFDIQVQIGKPSDIRIEQPSRRILALEPGQPRFRLLIVDDRWTNRQLLIKLLNPLGFELREVGMVRKLSNCGNNGHRI